MSQHWIVLVLVVAGFSARSAAATDADKAPPKRENPTLEKAKKLVEARLEGLNATRAYVAAVDAPAVLETFPSVSFVVVRFPLWPVAIAPPPPLNSQNLFVVPQEGKLDIVSSAKALEAVFRTRLGAVTSLKGAEKALAAWLRLSQEFVQDGFFKFNPKIGGKVGANDGHIIASGQVDVQPEGGNKGFLAAKLIFDAKGKLAKLEETNKVLAGIRPRCQATRLLDSDPVIRAIAEQDLLVLGRYAETYLREQRAQAPPELQRAIDRVWQRIVDEGR